MGLRVAHSVQERDDDHAVALKPVVEAVRKARDQVATGTTVDHGRRDGDSPMRSTATDTAWTNSSLSPKPSASYQRAACWTSARAAARNQTRLTPDERGADA